VVEHLTHNLKIVGSKPATVLGGEKNSKKMVNEMSLVCLTNGLSNFSQSLKEEKLKKVCFLKSLELKEMF
jgi:hypothetical protein